MVEPISDEQAFGEAEQVFHTINTDGWKVIASEFNERIAVAMEKLISEDDPSRVKELQHEIRAMKAVLGFPVSYVAAVETARKNASS